MLNASPTAIDFDVYQPRNPKASAYYRCVEDHFEQLKTVWDERYQRRFGFWRPYVTDVIRRYLDCGDLHCCDRRAEFWPPARRPGLRLGE